MKIDWSEAPEGTTHCNQYSGVWIKLLSPGGGQYQAWLNGCWEMGFGCMNNSYHKRPDKAVIEWNGEGLPPAGTVCEVDPTIHWHGTKVRVLCHDEGDAVCRVLEGDMLGDLKQLMASELRPIRTAEQIAADERLHKVRSALTEIKASRHFPSDEARKNVMVATVEAMIDAGFVKQVSP